jgi:AraC-like DNA-binding protein
MIRPLANWISCERNILPIGAHMAGAENRHVDLVHEVVDGKPPEAGFRLVAQSWVRCADTYGLDPSSNQPPTILTDSEVAYLREEAEKLRRIAQIELDSLYRIVGPIGYVVLLSNNEGIVIEHRGNEKDAEEFRRWGIWLGGVWGEGIEGTNGIGTTVVEGKPVTIHKSEHFRARHMNLSCAGAPLFDAKGDVVGVLDVSSCDPELSEHAHALTGSLTTALASAIEERMFREQFRKYWIVGLQDPLGAKLLLAVDGERRIAGFNRAAAPVLARSGHNVAVGLSLWAMFVNNDPVFRGKDQNDIHLALELKGDGEPWLAVVTPPLLASGPGSNSELDSLYWRPRLDALSNPARFRPMAPTRGGLPPAVLRRVRDYVESHLDQAIDLNSLAAVAGLSVYHFARAFKQSTGGTPHEFIVARKLAKARDLLKDTDLPVSEIAFAVGFSDQSHLSRRFRNEVGTSPGQFRRSQN